MLLQTATVTVCGDTGSKASVRVLLDSGSQRTFMTHQLARKLNLSSQSNETLLVSTFGGKKPHNLNTYVVHFTVVIKKNISMLLHANVVPEITGPVQRGPLLHGDLDFLRLIEPGQLADSVPETGNTSTVDILVGSDYFYFWEILEGERVNLSSGLLLLSSKFGYILTGKYYDPKARGYLLV